MAGLLFGNKKILWLDWKESRAGFCREEGDDDDELMLNVLRCHLTY